MISNTESSHFESLYPPDTRYKEIEHVLTFLKEGNSCQVVALPGVGRSNLLRMLSYNHELRIKHLGDNQKWFHFVLVNFAEIRKKPLSEAIKFLFLNLIDSLRERNMAEEYQKANEIFKESLLLNDELVFFQGLKRAIDLLAIEKELSIVFMFDRFETYIPMLTDDFFTNLRVIRSRAKYRFSIIFSLNRPLEELIEPQLFADYYEFVAGHSVYLPLLDEADQNFRIAYLEKVTGKTLDGETKKQLLHLTGGHGKVTRVSVETLLSLNQELGSRNHELSEFLLQQKTVQGALYEIWYSLNPQEQKALAENNELGIMNQEYLEKTGLIKNGTIQIPLFTTFVSQLPKATAPQEEKLSFDLNTNAIMKGKSILSDTLTSLEFRLLRFLIENPEKVLSRDEIIHAVWKDNASIAGVTDQALDQLIFRVRRKIEVDPNNPQLLQTIKGRGFRFLP